MNTEQETLQRVIAILKEFGLPPEGEADQFEWLREQLSAARRDEQAEVVGWRAAKLPCDVSLPPATVIRAGCTVETLLTGLRARGMVAPPPAVAAGGVTEERVEAAHRVFENASRHNPEVSIRERIRAALTAALPVGDEGIRDK